MQRLIVLAIVVLAVAACVCKPLETLRVDLNIASHLAQRPRLLFATHDYEHIDLFALQRMTAQWFSQTGIPTAFVVADRMHNRAFCKFVHRGTCIPVQSGTVEKACALLKRGHVCMFIYRGAKGTGAYYMYRAATRSSIVRVVSSLPPRTLESGASVGAIVRDTCGKKFCLEERPFVSPSRDPQEFMRALKAALYPSSRAGGGRR